MRHHSVLEILADRACVVVAQGWGPSLANCMGISGGVCLRRGLFSIIWWRTCPRNFVVQTDNTATMSAAMQLSSSKPLMNAIAREINFRLEMHQIV